MLGKGVSLETAKYIMTGEVLSQADNRQKLGTVVTLEKLNKEYRRCKGNPSFQGVSKSLR